MIWSDVLKYGRLKTNSSAFSITVGHGYHIRTNSAHWPMAMSCLGNSASSDIATDGRSDAVVVSACGTSNTDRRDGRFIGLEVTEPKLVYRSWCCSCCRPCYLRTPEWTYSLTCWTNTHNFMLSVCRRMRRKITSASASVSD
jgi:hypothetical protein